jgi:tetratricopeptide (TPR) repeat protein
MKQLTCEMCGSTDLIKQNDLYVCQNCQTKYSTEAAKKMMIEGTGQVAGTVQIDKTNYIDNYLQLAQSSFNIHNHNEVEEFCKKILEIDSNNIQAWILRTKNATVLGKGRNVIQEYSKKVFEIDSNNFEISIFMARYELKYSYDKDLAKSYYCKAIDCASDSEVFEIYEDVKKILDDIGDLIFSHPTLEDKANKDLIPALKLILERRRVSHDLLKANFGSSARAVTILSVLEMNGFIYKPEGANRWEINFKRIEKYFLQNERGNL